ncbi:uncharacterized protein LOC111325144 [Paramuricea clavata]|uniref:Uncharacterized protein LOC111325144 n=1 Tax=Paramuricea clavata TaxID=317549 RepID=A0A7D9HLY1_PARCT|nr:uncharacterized protein LOC111325144 [Paramuricea clavata]
MKSHGQVSVEAIKRKNDEIDETFNMFAVAHVNVHSQLVERSEIKQSEQYYKDEYDEIQLLYKRVNLWIEDMEERTRLQVEDEVNPEDSASQRSATGRSITSNLSKQHSTSSSTKLPLVEEAANRKALKAKLELLGEKQALAERRLKLQKTRDEENMRLQQAEERLTVKSELAECYAREKVFAEAEAAERGTSLNIKEPLSRPAKSTSMKHEQSMSGASNSLKSDNRPYEDNSEVLSQTKRQLMNSVRNREINPLTLNDLFIQQQTNAMALVFLCLPNLIQYTTEEVQELMRSCSAMDPERGYLEARKLLKKRFGQNYRIATAYVDKLTKGPVIKREDNAAIQRLSVQLTSCMNTLTEIGYMSKIENPECLKLIIARLPYDTRKRWRVIANNITEDEEREISLRDVTQFVDKQARIVNHPVFGNILADYDHTGKKIRNEKLKGTSLATQAGKGNDDTKQRRNFDNVESPRLIKNCIVCNQAHTPEEFRAMSYEKRIELVKRKGLCFNCLTPHHMAKDCRRQKSCKEYSRRHSTMLHLTPSRNDQRLGSQRTLSSAEKQVQTAESFTSNERSCTFTDVPRLAVGLSVVPVKVKVKKGGHRERYISTYALLDGGSNTTFCTEILKDQLGLTGDTTKFSLTTMTKKNKETKSIVISLEVYDLDENVFLELPTVFTMPSMPVTQDDIPKQADKPYRYVPNNAM